MFDKINKLTDNRLKKHTKTNTLKTTTIYFVRHTEIDNPKDIFYGRLSGFPLNDLGRKHAEKLKGYFKDKKIKAIYTSPTLRTKETALILNSDLNLKINYSELISEWESKWEGMSQKKISAEEIKIYKTKPTALKVGETMQELAQRMLKFLKEIIEKHQGENIICVSHANPITILRLTLQNKSLDLLWEYTCEMGSITKMTFSNSKLKNIEYIEI